MKNFQYLLKESWPKGLFPMVMFQNHLQYAGTVINGEKTVVKDKNSGISLFIPKGVRGFLVQCVHTDLRPFETFVPKAECFISPVVEIHCDEIKRTKAGRGAWYCLQVPHCLHGSFYQIKVRCGDQAKSLSFVEVPHGQLQEEEGIFYEVDKRYIRVYSTHFCQIICTSCKQTCSSFILALPFGSLHQFDDETIVKIKLYLCSALYKIEDFIAVCIFYLFHH